MIHEPSGKQTGMAGTGFANNAWFTIEARLRTVESIEVQRFQFKS